MIASALAMAVREHRQLCLARRQVAKLPASEQDALAAIAIEELASEQRWAESFAKSQNPLAKLAGKALADHAAGRAKPF